MRRSWVEKYKLPPTHHLWVGQPFAVHLAEFFEDKAVQKQQLEEELKEPGLDPDKAQKLVESIKVLDDLLSTEDERKPEETGLELTGDPVMDALEVAESLGEELDLDISPEEAKEYLARHGY